MVRAIYGGAGRDGGGAAAEEHATGEWPEEGACDDELNAFDISAYMGYSDGEPVAKQLELVKAWAVTPQVQAQIAGLAAELMETTSRQGRNAKMLDGEPLWTAVSGMNAHRRMADALKFNIASPWMIFSNPATYRRRDKPIFTAEDGQNRDIQFHECFALI